MPRKIASRKKQNASSMKGKPNSAPHRPIIRGQNSGKEIERIVPETAPTAKRMAKPLAHFRASAIHTWSPVRFALNSAKDIAPGSPMPNATKKMWKMNDTAIWARAASSDDTSGPDDGVAPAAVRGHHVVGLLRPPRPWLVRVRLIVIGKDRVDHLPGRHDLILPGEQHSIAVQRVAQ